MTDEPELTHEQQNALLTDRAEQAESQLASANATIELLQDQLMQAQGVAERAVASAEEKNLRIVQVEAEMEQLRAAVAG